MMVVRKFVLMFHFLNIIFSFYNIFDNKSAFFVSLANEMKIILSPYFNSWVEKPETLRCFL